jgi:hypothetical protein
MVDISTLGTVAGVGAALVVILQFLKATLPDGAKPWVPWISVALGIGLAVVDGLVTGHSSGPELFSLVLTGFTAGAMAVFGYQAVVDPLKPTPPHPSQPPVPPRG